MIVALAGASSGIGHHLADGILEHGGHTLIILSRHESPEFTAKGAHVKVVSFDSKESLVAALEGVHTVISAIGDHSRSGPAQLALAQAAISANVTRFIPSGWSGIDGGKDDVIELYRFQQPVLAALRESKLEWSHPENGIFINYFATPTKGIGHLKPLKFWIDVENCTATIPGDGEKRLVYTAAEDVGKFIAKALDVPGKWPRSLRIVGSSVTHNEILKIAEKVRGKPFKVTYKSEQDLRGELVPNPPSPFVNLLTGLSLAVIEGRFSFEPTLSDHVSVPFVSLEDFIGQWWGKA